MELDKNVFVEVVQITPNPNPSDLLWGFSIDDPQLGYVSDIDELPIKGWVLAKQSKATEIHIISGENLIQTIPVGQTRLDVAKNYPDASDPANSGFSVTFAPSEVNLTESELWEGEGELILQVLLSNNNKLNLGTVRIRRKLSDAEYLAALGSQIKQDIEKSQSLIKSGREKLKESQTRLQKFKEGLLLVHPTIPEKTLKN